MYYTNVLLSIVSEYKRAKQEIKKSASDTMKLQKKMKKGNCAYLVFKPSVVVALFPPKYLDFYISYTMLEIRTRLDFFCDLQPLLVLEGY